MRNFHFTKPNEAAALEIEKVGHMEHFEGINLRYTGKNTSFKVFVEGKFCALVIEVDFVDDCGGFVSCCDTDRRKNQASR